MCQQTQVRTVIPYFERWMQRFPTVRSLAEAALDDVLAHWAGLGYYSRARNLHKAAKIIVCEHGGSIPDDPAALSALPGIGAYTRGAVLSLAFNRPEALVDANVARVLSRLFCVTGDTKSGAAHRTLWRYAEELVPKHRPGDHNQALMELGALVCTPLEPACSECPLERWCRASLTCSVAQFPTPSLKPRTVRTAHACAALVQNGRVWLMRRPTEGLWGGLWELPRVTVFPDETAEEAAQRAAVTMLGTELRSPVALRAVRHQVTHHAITLHGFFGTSAETPKEGEDLRAWPLNAEPPALGSPQRQLWQMLLGYAGERPGKQERD
jgi:A/G-specific adenine glycosylase